MEAAVKLPGSAKSPYDVIKSKFKDVRYLLGKQYEQDERVLKAQSLSAEDYRVKSTELDAHYTKLLNSEESNARGKIDNLNSIKASAGRGEITGDAAYQAGWKMVLPSEAYNARFPSLSKESGASRAKPMSAGAIRSAGTLMGEFITSAEEKRGNWSWLNSNRSQSSMIDKYEDWRAQSGYEEMDPMHQRQLDLQWDGIMRGDKVYRDWFSDKEKKTPNADVVALRLKSKRGSMGKAVAKKLVTRQYGSGRPGSVTPIGASFQKSLAAKAKKDTPDAGTDAKAPSAEELNRLGTEEAYNEGVKLGYWE